MNESATGARVCPSCGSQITVADFCPECGLNLRNVKRLPSRDEWEDRQTQKDARRRRGRGLQLVGIGLAGTILLAAVLFGAAQLLNADVATYRMPSESMKPTLDVGDRLTVNRDAYNSAEPELGDLVVFHPPMGAETNECGATQ